MTQMEVFYEGQLRTRCVHKENGQVLLTDAPKDNMGKGELFSPTDLVAASLGTCILTLIGIAANKLKADVAGLRLTIEKEMTQAPPRRVKRLTMEIYCPKTFDDQITQKLEKAATSCPVHESLHPDILQEFHFHWGIT